MRLLLVGRWSGVTIGEIGARFAEGEHSAPPAPCKLVARWHDPSAKIFWVIVEDADVSVLQEWMSRWSDIIEWETHTALDDVEVGAMLGKLL